jgi:hypothetical protein
VESANVAKSVWFVMNENNVYEFVGPIGAPSTVTLFTR